MPYQVAIRANETIYLTEIVAADRDHCVALISDREIYERSLRIPHPYGDKDFDIFLNMCHDVEKKFGHPLNFAIRNQSDKMIGGIGLEGLRRGHCAEVGYWLGKPYWGNGIMTDAVGALTAYARQRWKLVRITAHVFTGNLASARVLEKAGFQFEGALAKFYRKDGRFIDAKAYALIDNETL